MTINKKSNGDSQNLTLLEGDAAPDFDFKGSDGRPRKLSNYKNNTLVTIYFYPKDFTPGCSMQANEFSRDYSKFKDANIEVIGISPDNEQSHIKFRKEMNIPYELVSDTDHQISKRYGVYGKKSFMGREYMGINRTTFLIDKEGRIKKIFRKVKPAGHSSQVLNEFTPQLV